MFYLKTCLTGGHSLLEGSIIGGHIVQFEISYWITCFTEEHILQDDLSYRRTPLM